MEYSDDKKKYVTGILHSIIQNLSGLSNDIRILVAQGAAKLPKIKS